MKDTLFNIQINSDKLLVSRDETTQRILEVRVQAPPAEQNHRPELNLAIILDRSGSMAGAKLDYVKQAACHVLDQLSEHDHVALVVYDDHIQVLTHSIAVTSSNRNELKRLISSLQAGNMTNLGDGWLAGCREIASSAQEGMINRALLLTDGLANVGITDLEILAGHALELYKESISTSTFGVGMGFNEHLLEAMANRGGGNFYYISTPERIPEVFLKEFNDLIGITIRKVEVRLEIPPSFEWHVLGGWAAEYKDGCLHIYFGDMLNAKVQDVYVRLQIPTDGKSDMLVLIARVFGLDSASTLLEDQATLEFRYTDPKVVEATSPNRELMERYGAVELADSATEALKLERLGEREAADRLMQASININRPFVNHRAVAAYEDLSHRVKAGMTEPDRKSSSWEIYHKKRLKKKEEEEK